MLEKLPNKWYTISNLGFNQKGSLYILFISEKTRLLRVSKIYGMERSFRMNSNLAFY